MFKNIFSFKPTRLVMMTGGETPNREDIPNADTPEYVFGQGNLKEDRVKSRTMDQQARDAAAAAFRKANRVHPDEIRAAKAGEAVQAQNVMAASQRATQSLRGDKETSEGAEKRARIENARELQAKIAEYKDFSSKNVRRVMYDAADALMKVAQSEAPKKMKAYIGRQAQRVGMYKNIEETSDNEQVKIRNAGLAANIAMGAANRALG